jgi:uncharacterized protein (DUF1697 family)
VASTFVAALGSEHVKHAAFFRNLNLGRPSCPGKAQLEQAFVDAGAREAASFLGNGTVLFAAPTRVAPRKLLLAVSELLESRCGFVEPVYARPLSYLAELVASEPFALVDRAAVHECCVSFLHPDAVLPLALAIEAKSRGVEVLRFTPGEALSVSRKTGKTPGSPNAFLEKLLGRPVTTRSWNTVARLVQKHA